MTPLRLISEAEDAFLTVDAEPSGEPGALWLRVEERDGAHEIGVGLSLPDVNRLHEHLHRVLLNEGATIRYAGPGPRESALEARVQAWKRAAQLLAGKGPFPTRQEQLELARFLVGKE